MIDAADLRILALLQSDSRISWVQMAERVNLSASACQRRVEAMRNDGVIARFTVDIDPAKIGLTIQAFVQIKVERQKTERATAFRQRITSYPEVRAAYKLSGSVDYLVHIMVSDIKALSKFIDDKMLALDGVVDASSAIVLEDLDCSSS
ncbi:Lrp/AsnC family transcriptional regulator [Fretibacter rubidus]|uniref:Lrp/AsnC family transcriptional regulator n=1 Tax=Fretibacter rubidus TaxID=570162 RepID=UPI00352A3B3B